MKTKFTEDDLAGMSAHVREHFQFLLGEGAITETQYGYYFACKEDVYGERIRHKMEVMEYVVWNLAYKTYKGMTHE